ncbi:MAG: hypothetical protein ABIL09_21830 [Gemmatimonadota bacterium]
MAAAERSGPTPAATPRKGALATGLLLLPVGLSAVLVGAHFLRAGLPAATALCVLVPWILLIRCRVAARLVQVGLVLAAAEWVRTLAGLAAARSAAGEPWGRMAAILGAVALFTLASAGVFQARLLRQRYRLGGAAEG